MTTTRLLLAAGLFGCAALLSGCGASTGMMGKSRATLTDGTTAALAAQSQAGVTESTGSQDNAVASDPFEEEGTGANDVLTSLAYAPPPPGAGQPHIHGLVTKYAAIYGIPEALLHRSIQRESSYNPEARNGPYWGLMQIRHDTASTMGYRGPASGLLDAETNLIYAGKYMRGAYLVAQGNSDRAMKLYASGYYYDAKRMGLLKETGLR